MAKKSIKTRVIFGSLMILVLGSLFAADFYFAHSMSDRLLSRGLLVAIVAGLVSFFGAIEVAYLAKAKGVKPFPWLMAPGSAILTVSPLAFGENADRTTVLVVIFLILILAQILRRETAGAIGNIAWSLLGVVYIGLFLSYLMSLRIEFGPLAVLLPIVAVKAADIGAYFTGVMFGKHKLIPWLSPGKTIEGLVGAVIFSTLVVLLFLTPHIIRYSPTEWELFYLVLLGVGFAVVGHFGDLTESLLKRDAQVKDSAHLLPEFGGVLDLIDSILPAGFIWYMLLKVQVFALS